MKVFPILYSRTSKDGVQQWQIVLDGDRFWVIEGLVGMKLTTNSPTVVKGKNLGKKNETSPQEQAALECQSKWEKKAKTGYCEDITKIDSCITYVEPMLAKTLDDYITKIDFSKGVLVQNKYNGFRAIATLENGKVVLKSRKGELYISIPHLNKDLEPFFAVYPNAVLDCELFNNGLRSKLNEMSKLVRKSKHATPEDLKRSSELVFLYCYDGFGWEAGYEDDQPYEKRKEWIDKNLPKYSKYFRKVDSFLVHSMAEVDAMFGKFLEDGQEGCIVRLPGSPYEVGKRTKRLLKYKPEDSAEATITNIQEGKGNYAGIAKIISFKWDKGEDFDGTLMGDMEQGREILKNKADWIGKEVTFKYTGFTGKGSGKPNYARLDPDNCFEGDK